MILRGHIKTIKTSESVMGDMVNLLTLEIYGDMKELHDFEKKSLVITLESYDLP